MVVRKMRLQGPCPACAERAVDYITADLDIPHFGNAQQLVFICQSCGFRHTDFMISGQRDPMRHTLEVREPDDVDARVIRSTSGTVRIPELGVLIEPGPASDAYVSNIEGVLLRIRGVLQQLKNDADDAESRAAAAERLDQLDAAREARFPITFIIEDPYGNSAVVHDRAKAESIPASDAARLKTGSYTIDLTEADPGALPGLAPSGNGGDGDGHDPAPAP